MAAVVKEGWYEDPAGRHEYQRFSEGTPTDLVKDGKATSRDGLSMSDPELFQSMDLELPPDVASLPYKTDASYGGYMHVAAAAPGIWRDVPGNPPDAQGMIKPAGLVEIVAALLPILIGLFLLMEGFPILVTFAVWLLAPLIAVLGQRRRKRISRPRIPAR